MDYGFTPVILQLDYIRTHICQDEKNMPPQKQDLIDKAENITRHLMTCIGDNCPLKPELKDLEGCNYISKAFDIVYEELKQLNIDGVTLDMLIYSKFEDLNDELREEFLRDIEKITSNNQDGEDPVVNFFEKYVFDAKITELDLKELVPETCKSGTNWRRILGIGGSLLLVAIIAFLYYKEISRRCTTTDGRSGHHDILGICRPKHFRYT